MNNAHVDDTHVDGPAGPRTAASAPEPSQGATTRAPGPDDPASGNPLSKTSLAKTSLAKTSLAQGRSTRQRAAVSALLEESSDFQSAQQLHDRLRHRGDSVGLTTVYRTLQSLADAGAVDVVRTGDGEAVYRRCSTGSHHHHLVCRTCGKTIEVEGPAVESWANRTAAEHGFSNVSHTLEIFGTCAECSAAG